MWLLSYWILPVLAFCMWLAMLLALFIDWEVLGHKHLPSMATDQHIAYISDVGAYHLKPLFITGCAITMVCLVSTFASERWLRHTGRLANNNSMSQKILSIIAIIAAIAGAAGLILLSCFDTYHYPHLHDDFLCLFIGGYIVSAIFLCAEYQRLGIHYRQHRVLRMSFWMKLGFILVELAMAIAFGVCNTQSKWNAAAVLEWIISLIFSFYILSFVVDLLPSVRTKHHVPQGWKEQVREHELGVSQPNDYGEPLTTDSAGPNQMTSHPNTTNGHARNF